MPWLTETARHLGIDLPVIETMRRDDEAAPWREAQTAVRRHARRRGPSPRSSQPAPLDPNDPGWAGNPYPLYDQLRRVGPAHLLHGDDDWLVVGFEHVRRALNEPGSFSSRIMQDIDPVLIGTDPPDLPPVRREIASKLSRHEVEKVQPFVEETARGLLEPLLDAAEFDVIADYSAPLMEVVAERVLAPFEDQPESLRELLPIAATMPTKLAVATALIVLLDEPELHRRVRADPADRQLIDAFVDELLRRNSPMRATRRITTEDVRLGEVTIPRASSVLLSVHAANRDPAVFDEPDRLVLGRDTRDLAFGAGAHRCPGARLARMEIAVALQALFRAMPDFRVVQPRCTLRWRLGPVRHGLERLVLAPS